MAVQEAPESIMLEYLRANGDPVRYGDLGAKFVELHSIAPDQSQRAFRVAIERRSSKAGNAFYGYSQGNVTLPDGLSTWIRVEGVVVPMGGIRPSQKGHPTREGSTTIVIAGILYLLTVYITEGKDPYWVKVVAHKKPNSSAALKKAQAAPWPSPRMVSATSVGIIPVQGVAQHGTEDLQRIVQGRGLSPRDRSEVCQDRSLPQARGVVSDVG